ncbi:MAG: hydantoinase/oxoprolinase family protein [Caldilineaceae bacterium]
MMDSSDKLHNTPIYVGIDVGGTFTDFVVWQDGRLRIHKVPTTPDDQSRAILQGLHDLDLLAAPSSPGFVIVHGMTVATNALLERRGAVTALLTTEGFADALVIGRQNRPHLYQLYQQRPPLLAGDALRLEVDERLDADGNVLRPLDDGQLAAIAQRLRTGGAESLAVVFLFSYRNPTHEQRAAELLHRLLPDLPISLSSEVLPEYREYERTATTLINAYVQPLVARYLARLEQALQGVPVHTLRIMQSNGGVIELRQAASHAARLVLSGPAGGAVGAFAVADNGSGPPQILTFDMGGTSTDVCLCPGRIPTTAETMIGGLPLRLPMIDIHTVGAGGGSIAFVDAGGALQVGPRSAGALPGPACYGRGGILPTVTDANLVLGRLAVDGFLGGSGQVQLDADAARHVLGELGTQLGLSAEEAALGVVRVANATMERALRAVSVEQGYDPRQFTLLPFGGAGPLHACDLANALEIRRILCPAMPGVLSAYGMLVADMSAEYATSVLSLAADLVAEPSALSAAVAQLEARTRKTLALEASAVAQTVAALDMRYRGQSYELTVPLALPLTPANLEAAVDAFHRAHAQRYGYAMPAETVEAVTLRIRSSSPGSQIGLPRRPLSGRDAAAARLGDRAVWFDTSGPVTAACYQRERLEPGNHVAGPALVLQYDSTVLLAPGWTASVDQSGNLLCEKRETHA